MRNGICKGKASTPCHGPAAVSRDETYTRILKMQPHLPSHLSDQAKDFVSQCLRKEASQRPSVMQLLRHPWVKTYQVWVVLQALLQACSKHMVAADLAE
jgi:serine/threonine protein kinase